jgi:uncharacterized tellurite resistance protein B-like protein
MSEKKLTFAHGLIGMFIEMTAADGKMDKVELQTVGKLVATHLGPAGYDAESRKKIIGESFNWWSSFEKIEDRAESIFTLALGMKDALGKSERIAIGKSLMVIGGADGEVSKSEVSFLHACLECMGLTFDELK